jgi:hypothetical protein
MTLDGVSLTVSDVSLVVGTVPRVLGMAPRVMEMAGFSLVGRRWQALFARRKRANTLQIQALCGITLDFIGEVTVVNNRFLKIVLIFFAKIPLSKMSGSVHKNEYTKQHIEN